MKIKIPKGAPKKSRGTWHRKPVTKIKESAKKYKRDWDLKDFIDSVDAVMQKQEKENPAMKQVHARLSPEWKQVSEKLSRFLALSDEAALDQLREEIASEGEMATRVLLDFVQAIKNQTK